jgi:hypothetical protein
LRVAALAFGVLAGLVASLILALGGLDVTADLGATADRQSQAIRFGLFVIGNLGIFGAALALAAPLAGGVFLLLGAVAWIGAALLMHHTTDLVLITPPALLLIAAIFAFVAHFRRRPTDAEDEDDDAEIIPPARPERAPPRPSEMMDEEEDEEVGIPAFAAAEAKAPPQRSAFDDDHLRPQNGSDWNPRRRQPPPPRAKPAFRPVEEEYDEDDEPSGFSRFALGLSGILSFGLYAALAGAAVLIVWSLRSQPEAPAVTVADVSSAVIEVQPSAELPAPASSEEPTLEPILTGEPIREAESPATAPSTSPSELVAEAAPSQEPRTFGGLSDGPVTVPTLADDFASEDEATPLPEISAAPPALPPAEPSEPPPAEAAPIAEAPQPEPTIPAAGQPWPQPVPAAIAAQRLQPGTGPTTVVVSRPANSNNTGL